MIATSIEDHIGSRKAMLEDLLNRSAKYKDDDLREAQEKRLRLYIHILDEMTQEADAIRRDLNLSEAGMWAKLRQLAKATLQKLNPLFEAADNIERSYASQYAELSKIPAAPAGYSELGTLAREQELRGWLRGLPVYSVMFIYLAAVQTNDVETLRAIRLSPGPSLLPVDFIERVTKDHLAMTQQDTLVHLESLDILRKELRGISEMLRNWLTGYEPVKFPTPPITQAPASMVAR